VTSTFDFAKTLTMARSTAMDAMQGIQFAMGLLPDTHPKRAEILEATSMAAALASEVQSNLTGVLATLEAARPESLGLHVTAIKGDRNMNVAPIEIVDVEKVVLSVAPKDEDGRPVASPNATWASSDETVITLQVAEDTLSAVAVSGAPGVATVTVTAGDLSDTIDITVKTGAPASLNLSAGVPQHE
jgi:hypothetical protein